MSPMRIDISRFAVAKGEAVALDRRPTKVAPLYDSTSAYQHALTKHVEQLGDLQQLLYAANRYALLVIFQGMDAAGKDGAIRHVMSGVNPQGVQVYSFRHPSATELEHDFLWRETAALPERGRIGIFNRSHYEEVLIVRVHPEILHGEGVPDDGKAGKKFWETRYESIVDFERHLHRNGTRIVKFFLHLSKEEQKRRFLARIDDPKKNWKFNLDDVKERRFWNDYMKAYEACLCATSRRHAPWYVVPADDKLNARLIVSQVLIDTLQSLRLGYPQVDAARQRELRGIRRRLVKPTT
jgi:PPK2 family polyphosphate:nucleotide phosphotransferase